MEHFRFTANLRRRNREFLDTPCADTYTAPSPPSAPPPEAIGAVGEATLTSLSPTVHSRAHPCCSAFSGFGQMREDLYPPRQGHTGQSHCPRNAQCLTCISLLPPVPGNHSSAHRPTAARFPECHTDRLLSLIIDMQASSTSSRGLTALFYSALNNSPWSGSQPIFDKSAKAIQWRKGRFFQSHWSHWANTGRS